MLVPKALSEQVKKDMALELNTLDIFTVDQLAEILSATGTLNGALAHDQFTEDVMKYNAENKKKGVDYKALAREASLPDIRSL